MTKPRAPTKQQSSKPRSAPAHARDAALESAIVEAPQDRDAHRVYADWLQGQGDPLGNVIALALAALDEPKSQRKLKINAVKALDAYVESYWIPRFPALEHRFRAWNKSEKQASPDQITNWGSSKLCFRWGLLREVNMIDWEKAVARAGLALLRHPDARFVEEINMNSVKWFDDPHAFDGLESLRSLDVCRTKLRDLAPIAKLPRLEALDVFDTPVDRIDALARCRLRRLNLRSTKVVDLAPLAKMSTLENINLESTEISDIEPLMKLPNLSYAWLYKTKISKADGERLERSIRARVGDTDRPVVYGP